MIVRMMAITPSENASSRLFSMQGGPMQYQELKCRTILGADTPTAVTLYSCDRNRCTAAGERHRIGTGSWIDAGSFERPVSGSIRDSPYRPGAALRVHSQERSLSLD